MSYRNDIHSAHGMIDELKRENDSLNKKLTEKEKKVKCKTCGGRFHRAASAAFWVASGLVMSGLFAWLTYTAVIEHGPTHCYIRGEGLIFKLKQNVNWSSDRVIGDYRSIQGALDDAKKINCPVQ